MNGATTAFVGISVLIVVISIGAILVVLSLRNKNTEAEEEPSLRDRYMKSKAGTSFA